MERSTHDEFEALGDEVMAPPESLVCVDCGGPCHRLTFARDDGHWYVGDVVAYRCRDCLDRWDVVLGDDDKPDDSHEF